MHVESVINLLYAIYANRKKSLVKKHPYRCIQDPKRLHAINMGMAPSGKARFLALRESIWGVSKITAFIFFVDVARRPMRTPSVISSIQRPPYRHSSEYEHNYDIIY